MTSRLAASDGDGGTEYTNAHGNNAQNNAQNNALPLNRPDIAPLLQWLVFRSRWLAYVVRETHFNSSELMDFQRAAFRSVSFD